MSELRPLLPNEGYVWLKVPIVALSDYGARWGCVDLPRL